MTAQAVQQPAAVLVLVTKAFGVGDTATERTPDRKRSGVCPNEPEWSGEMQRSETMNPETGGSIVGQLLLLLLAVKAYRYWRGRQSK